MCIKKISVGRGFITHSIKNMSGKKKEVRRDGYEKPGRKTLNFVKVFAVLGFMGISGQTLHMHLWNSHHIN
jgi:hypothetical protein